MVLQTRVASLKTNTPLNLHICAAIKGHCFLHLTSSRTSTMAEFKTRPAKPKRPTCSTCSKPVSVCLCAMLNAKKLDNSIAVTVLQHSLEKNHPLNSVRIASLGLKNFAVSTVSDVNLGARFRIRLSGSEVDFHVVEHKVFDECTEEKTVGLVGIINGKRKLESFVSDCNMFENPGFAESSDLLETGDAKSFEAEDGEVETDKNRIRSPEFDKSSSLSPNISEFEQIEERKLPSSCSIPDNEKTVMNIGITKQGGITSLSHIWRAENSNPALKFKDVLKNPAAREALSRGFVVQKLQRRDREEHIEFEVEVPLGSVLLFPSEEASDYEGLRSIGFEVRNVIVLDGTWAKAKRMYAENPWLKLLPHLRLQTGTASLYGGVRMQPKAGCLSTIESIVFALRAFGSDDPEGLKVLLGVFEAMVGHQRRCQEESLKNSSG